MDIDTMMQIATPVTITIVGGAITLAGKWLMSGQKDIKEDISELKTGMDKRVTALEIETRTFMSKTDLQKEFDHEKAGRKTIQQGIDHALEKNIEDIVKLRESVARLDQNDTNLTNQYNDLKTSVEKGFEKTDSKLDKLNDCLTEIARKVA